ncbi:asparagine synthase (glutamine-hydrolysing) [Edaphobacter aggregans]|uniref:asparagine synthase (glutamine-hydrolyzing) n=1 Tax=Edaphobacter aggregans TaxID=570835 RepID=A0A3R9WHK9_9BACT|nr:asparagine synthase (glutamine-hydrolyzing) [Edaphobacter aggregans]RSL17380.1 asparagine synthase (glutamine-hydrolysing) [Edaphobacter aggregans]
MCGICGKFAFGPNETVSPELVRAMAATIRHRGPDDEGYYVSGPVGLGFRRLSIIDLQSGHQPLSNEDGSIWIVFNGEIYNYQELRSLLLSKGHVFKTKTDTEVIIHLYEEYGPDCLKELRGMFAFAIWDGNAKTLFLARDRVGIKPLYYCLDDSCLVFASEIKAILADPSIDRQIAPELIDRFLTFLYVPGEETLLNGISKLAPGHYLLVNDGKAIIRQYWDLRFREPLEAVSAQDAEAGLRDLLIETVGLHMIADVPVGILLSGGIDSTGILSLAVNATDKKISTFTVGFSGNEIADERPFARLVADKFGTQHYDMTISADDFAAFLPRYIWHMEEPVCEPPAIALYYVSKLAKKYVTVLLSGEGGDEAFAGYSNYRNLVWLERLKANGSWLNSIFAKGFSLADSLLGSRRLSEYGPLMKEHFPDYYYSRTSNPNRFTGNGLGKVYSSDFAEAIDREHSLEPVRRLQNHVRDHNTLDAMLYIDTKTWLPDDLLIKADKMTMANSIELRVPLLDHRVLEFAASLPPSLKLKGHNTKYILKQALSQKIPNEIRNRKKAGFPVPYESWLRNDLKDVIWDVLTDSKTISRGYFRKAAIESLLKANSNGANYSKEIFSLLSLELWQRTFLDKEQVAL